MAAAPDLWTSLRGCRDSDRELRFPNAGVHLDLTNGAFPHTHDPPSPPSAMEASITTLTARPILGVRATVKTSEIGATIGELAPRLAQHAGSRAAGPMLARYHSWGEKGGEMELALPVTEPVESSGDLVAGELPAGRAVVATHVGPYEGLPASWHAVQAWIEARELSTRSAPWEEYLDDCSVTPEAELRTRIVWPVE